jgi:hypothetical protein
VSNKGASLRMKKKIIFANLILSIFYLSSCSAILIKPEASVSFVDYKVINKTNGTKTVKIILQKKTESLHWIYLSCNYVFGCYMSCEGPINSCMKVASLSNFEMKYITTKKKGHSSQPKCGKYC